MSTKNNISAAMPGPISAHLYEELCGSRKVGCGVILLDECGNEICRLQNQTLREIGYATLFSAAPKLLEWAKMACDETRASLPEDAETIPSWLPELESVIGAILNPRIEP